jgi:hypothetical protein
MAITYPGRARARLAEEEAESAGGRPLLWSLLGALGWGAVQSLVIAAIVKRIGWAQLPYNTVEEVGVWLFLATNASAWLALCYALYRFRQPLLWFWWAACLTWWIAVAVPYQRAHTEFRAKVRASEATGLQLARRVEAFRRARGRLPGQLREVALRDKRPVPLTAFGANFDYRVQSLGHFQLVVAAGDKAYCYSSRDPKAGFRLGYPGP